MNAAEKKQVDVAKKSEIARKIWWIIWCMVCWTLALAFGLVGMLVPVLLIWGLGVNGAEISLFSLFYFLLCRFFMNQAKKAMGKNSDRAKFSDRRYLKHIAAINESFVSGGAKSAHQTLLSLLGNDKANAVLVLPWLVDSVLDKGVISTEDQASLEEFVGISRIAPAEIPYHQKERIVKSLIVSKIPCDQKERMARMSFLSGIPFEKERTGKGGEPTKKAGASFFPAFVSWGVCILFFILALISFLCLISFAKEIISMLGYFLIPIPFGLIVLSVYFGELGSEILNENHRASIEKVYSNRAILINENFVESGAEEAYRKILSVVENNEAQAKASSIRALPLIADTLLGKDAVTPEDRASFNRFMEISGVDSSQIPDELKERIVQSFLLSKIPYEQKEGLLRPIILRAKSSATAARNDEAQIRVVDNS
ncbi:MAG: hypothetical protein LBL72_06030 [Candidatus Accumulibacter sp.]|jgi:hypothetical protein|nr:hypothetical protein [Accumulibacter sp.]